MNGGNDKWKCTFCMNNMIVPFVAVHKLVDKSLRLYSKNNNMLSFMKIVQFLKMSREVEFYLNEKNPYLLNKLENDKFSNQNPVRIDFLKKDFLNSHPSAIMSTGIFCSSCNREACDFHINFGGFIFCKCSCCNRDISLCGWCRDLNKEEIKDGKCLECYKTYKKTTNRIDRINSTYNIFKNKLTLATIPEDSIINFKSSEPIDIKCGMKRLRIDKNINETQRVSNIIDNSNSNLNFTNDQLLKTVFIKKG